MGRKLQIGVFGGMILLSFLLHILLFGEAGYFTRQSLQDRLHAIRGQIEELDRENSRLAEQYALLEESGHKPTENQGATILTFESSEPAESDLSNRMEQKLGNPETVFFVLAALATASAVLLVRVIPRRA